MSRLLLIDGTGLLVRSQLAVRPDEERADELRLFFFVRSVIRFIKYHDPAYVLVAWDGEGGKDWRRSLYSGYKANRAEPGSGRYNGDALGYRAGSFLMRTGIYAVRRPFEADDIISWAVWRATLNGIQPVAIRSDDADMNQLVRGTIVTQYPLFGKDTMTDQRAVSEKYGCLPSHVPLVRALAGDSSDNIPGVPGIGLKTAVKICQDADYDPHRIQHKSLDGNPQLLGAVHVYRRIMDLYERREAVHTAMGRPVNLGLLCSWNKAVATGGAVRCFEQWDMKTLLSKANAGLLW